MGRVLARQCVRCERMFAEGEELYLCPMCGIQGILDIQYDYDTIEEGGFGPERLAADRDPTMWRYRELLPIGDRAEIPTVSVGGTPMFSLPAMALLLHIDELWIKDEGRSLSGSVKDRGSAVAVVKARELGFETVCCASAGNAASSLAGCVGPLGLKAVIFVPEATSETKLAQLLAFGGTVFTVYGAAHEAYQLCLQAADAFGWFNRTAAINPVSLEGKKTCGFEIAEQSAGHGPDWVSVSVGDGSTIAGIWKGLLEMHRFGIIDRLPKLLGTQTQGVAPLVAAFDTGTEEWTPAEGDTVAGSIAVGEPRNAVKALRAVRASGGAIVAVTDEEILRAETDLASQGVFAEPSGAAGIAGIHAARARGLIGQHDRVVHVVTGSGMKDMQGALKAAGNSPVAVPPTLEAVWAALERTRSSVGPGQ
jgi:threonine synthase